MSKAIIYVRVSTIDQTPENQKIELEEYAQRQGWDYDIKEEVESTRKTRPVKQYVLQQLRSKVYDTLLIWKLDRWGRSLQELVMDMQELNDKGINFVSLMDNIDYSTSSGQFMAHILAALAQYERGLIRERTLAGLKRAKLKGKRLGRPKGSKDSSPRRRSGYWARYQNGGK